MAYFEDEIKKDLEVGEIYTSSEIASILYFSSSSIVLCEDTSHFHKTNDVHYKVLNKMETFLHKNERFSYSIPSKKTKIFIVKKVIK